ncbi:hypothetical protein [Rhizobacter fulvus]
MEKTAKVCWLLRFATHLHKMHPDCDGVAAAQAAKDTYPEASHVPPEAAAERYWHAKGLGERWSIGTDNGRKPAE